jgi:hypothetical protein
MLKIQGAMSHRTDLECFPLPGMPLLTYRHQIIFVKDWESTTM